MGDLDKTMVGRGSGGKSLTGLENGGKEGLEAAGLINFSKQFSIK